MAVWRFLIQFNDVLLVSYFLGPPCICNTDYQSIKWTRYETAHVGLQMTNWRWRCFGLEKCHQQRCEFSWRYVAICSSTGKCW